MLNKLETKSMALTGYSPQRMPLPWHRDASLGVWERWPTSWDEEDLAQFNRLPEPDHRDHRNKFHSLPECPNCEQL